MEIKIVINADKIVSSGRRILASRRFKMGAAMAVAMIPLVVVAAVATNTYTFKDGTTISASEVNTNFEGLATTINANAATYRWNVFSTYTEAIGWVNGNDSGMFGGIAPSTWTDGNATASSISANKEVQRTLFTNKGWAKANALIWCEVLLQYSSTNGRVAAALFRVKNSTSSSINWTPNWWYTAYSGWSETASVSLNGANSWTSGGGGSFYQGSVTLSIPANRTSTVIFVSPSSYPYNWGYGSQTRSTVLAFYNNSLTLPNGLAFVDDLDSATGGYEQ